MHLHLCLHAHAVCHTPNDGWFADAIAALHCSICQANSCVVSWCEVKSCSAQVALLVQGSMRAAEG